MVLAGAQKEEEEEEEAVARKKEKKANAAKTKEETQSAANQEEGEEAARACLLDKQLVRHTQNDVSFVATIGTAPTGRGLFIETHLTWSWSAADGDS